jgi:hypothetical protein
VRESLRVRFYCSPDNVLNVPMLLVGEPQFPSHNKCGGGTLRGVRPATRSSVRPVDRTGRRDPAQPRALIIVRKHVANAWPWRWMVPSLPCGLESCSVFRSKPPSLLYGSGGSLGGSPVPRVRRMRSSRERKQKPLPVHLTLHVEHPK